MSVGMMFVVKFIILKIKPINEFSRSIHFSVRLLPVHWQNLEKKYGLPLQMRKRVITSLVKKRSAWVMVKETLFIFRALTFNLLELYMKIIT